MTILKILYICVIVVAFAQGVLMLFFPHEYVTLSNWWYEVVGIEKRLSVEKYERWHRRLAGFAMVATATYLAVMILWKIF